LGLADIDGAERPAHAVMLRDRDILAFREGVLVEFENWLIVLLARPEPVNDAKLVVVLPCVEVEMSLRIERRGELETMGGRPIGEFLGPRELQANRFQRHGEFFRS